MKVPGTVFDSDQVRLLVMNRNVGMAGTGFDAQAVELAASSSREMG